MKREIKFRLWNVDKKEWEEDFFVDSKNGKCYWGDNPVGNYCYTFEFEDEYMLSQYTGLKDKNSKGIYEGDVVLVLHPHKNRIYKGEVVYNGYEFSGKGFFFPHFDSPFSLFSEGTDYIEVVGNIYENPELLKKEL